MTAFFRFDETSEIDFMRGSLTERWAKRFNHILIAISGKVWTLPNLLRNFHERLTKLETAPKDVLAGRTATGAWSLPPLANLPTMYVEGNTNTGRVRFVTPNFKDVDKINFPASTAMYYGRKFLEIVAEAAHTTSSIDTDLERFVIEAALKVRQERGLRDWVARPETAEEAGARIAYDIKLGYSESGTIVDGVAIRAFRARSDRPAHQAHSWKPKERRNGHDRRIEQQRTRFLRRGAQRRRTS